MSFPLLSAADAGQALTENRVVILVLAWVLASVPVALLFFRVLFPERRMDDSAPVLIPPADAGPAGSFLDVPLSLPQSPPPLPETGVPFRHWRPVDGLVALLLIALFGSQALASLQTEAAVPAGGGETGGKGLPLSVEYMSSAIMFQLSLVALTLAYLGYLRGYRISAIFGLRRLSPAKALAVGCAWMIAAGAAILTLMGLLLKWLEDSGFAVPEQQALVKALQETPDTATLVLTSVSVVICAPIMEELLFRGLFYGVAKRFTHPVYAALAVSVFFGVVHGNLLSLLPLTLLGLIFTLAYERTRCLLVPMVMHAVFNGVQMCLIFYAKEIEDIARRAAAGG